MRDQFAVAGEPRQVLPRGDARQRRHHIGRQRTRAAHVDVEAGVGRGHRNVERLIGGIEQFRHGPGGLKRAVEAFGEDRAAVDCDHMVRARRRKPDFEHVMSAAPGVKHDAAAAVAVGVDEVGDRCGDAGLLQRGDDQIALPFAVGRTLPMLQGAAAANAEMRADRRDALRARRLHIEKLPAVGMAGPVLDLDRLAGQRAGDIDRAVGTVGDAVAAMAEPIDQEALNHDTQPRLAAMKNSRLPSPPRIAEATTPPTRQPSNVMNAPMSSQTAL